MSNFVSVENYLDDIRRKNFFWYWTISSFVWMCFHFTLIFFFLLQLKSPILVWFFLGFGNLVAFVIDSPIWVLQKYFSAKKLFITSAVLMLVVSLIFLYFMFSTWNNTLNVSPQELLDFSKQAFTRFFSSLTNMILLVISVILYWVIKELSDVTSLSYIMNNADPSEYAELLSKNNIFSWIGSLIWLLSSWVILAFNPFLALSIIIWIIAIFIYFISKYFDNSKDIFKLSVNFSDIKKLKVISPRESIESVKQYAVTTMQKTDFSNVAKNMKFIFLKPLEIKKFVNWTEIYETTKKDIESFYIILFKPPYSYKLIIFASVLTLFWFWDTFVISFLIDYLDKIIWNSYEELSKLYLWAIMTSYLFIWIIAIPAYWTQNIFIKLSKKIGALPIMFFWVVLSWISIFFLWLVGSFIPVLILWFLNSFWYAAAMPISQWEFSDSYNQVYAGKKNLSEIDSNASSAPLKMLLNLANVIWLVLWWIIVSAIGYIGTFLLFWILLIAIFVVSQIKKKEWDL